MICKTVVNVVEKIRKLPVATGYGKRSKIINEEDFNPIQSTTSKLAVEVNQGIMIEALKKFMFACQAGEHILPAAPAAQE